MELTQAYIMESLLFALKKCLMHPYLHTYCVVSVFPLLDKCVIKMIQTPSFTINTGHDGRMGNGDEWGLNFFHLIRMGMNNILVLSIHLHSDKLL